MVAQSFACPACAEGIPPGRLSCPHCGTVLAAVARSYRAGTAPAAPAAPATKASAASWLDANVTLEPATARVERPEAASEPDPEPGLESEPGYALDRELELGPEPMPTPVAALLASSGASSPPLEFLEHEVGPTEFAGQVPAGSRWAEIAGAPVAPPPDVLRPVEPGPRTPAAYVPPGLAFANPVAEPVEQPVEPPARILPRTWGPADAALATAVGAPMGAGALAPKLRRFGLPAIDRGRIDEAAGVIVLAGSMAAAVGFLLPWSRIVIGATFTGSYLDSWGLAGSAHVVVFLFSLAVLALAAIPNRIGTWLRTSVAGIALGALVLGLAWPYAFGRLGAGLGTVLEVVAAALLLGGGLLSSLVQRHADPASGV